MPAPARHAGGDWTERLAESGFLALGGFTISDGEGPAESGLTGRSALVVGSVGLRLWNALRASAEWQDGEPDPLDRFTRRTLRFIAGPDAVILHPSDRPYWPFGRWAARAAGMAQSPLGLMIHPHFGLWVSLRAAIVTPTAVASAEPQPSPCDSCADRPCLRTCPVAAFTAIGFAAARCRDRLAQDGAGQGCDARLACPVGTAWRQEPAQLAYHMAAFAGTPRR